jgi:mono/diheme cytochrome c family protein
MLFGKIMGLSVLLSVVLIGSDLEAGQHMMRSRVPAEKIDEARALTSPLPQSAGIVEQGKALYEGKGTCINCHGANGRGDGTGAATLNPPPRVFRSHGFWQHRTEGEIFWVIKYGSPGTAMIPFGGLLTDEEIWTVMQYERSFAEGRGPGGMGRYRGVGPMGNGDHRGPHGMGGPHGRHGGQDE